MLDHIEESGNDDLVSLAGKQGMKLDIPQIPELLIDNTDRNRTSPFAFTGNRFEFRAVGSEANCASAMIALNAAVAEQLARFKQDVDALIEKGEPKISAIIEIIRRYIKECKPVRFDGNGYSDEWKAEAAHRGLDCETSCPLIFDNYLKPASIAMFESWTNGSGGRLRNELPAHDNYLQSLLGRMERPLAKQDVDALIEKGEPKISAIIEIIRCYIKECKPVRFDGNGYSDEWKAEAARRGLDCETSCPLIFDNYLKPASIAMFESTGVMTRKELEARNEVKWETYTKKIQIEARVLGDLAMNHIIPVATEYQSKLIDNVYKMKELFPAEKASQLSAENMKLIEEIARRTIFITEHVNAMVEARKVANKIESEREKAIAYHDTIAPMLEEIRYHIDKLELIVDNQMWTLPKYRELLFIR